MRAGRRILADGASRQNDETGISGDSTFVLGRGGWMALAAERDIRASWKEGLGSGRPASGRPGTGRLGRRGLAAGRGRRFEGMRAAAADEFSDVPDGPTPWALYPWLAIAGGPVADVVS